jgi:phosphate starvation-inducible PhoH-like protein
MEISIEQLGKNIITDLIDKGNIQILPLAYMRGVTFKNAFVVADEMQNSTVQQMRMIFTRIGENSKLVVTGDTEQSDLYFRDRETRNGLSDCLDRLKSVEEIGFFEMLEEHCVRSPIVAKIDKLYRSK